MEISKMECTKCIIIMHTRACSVDFTATANCLLSMYSGTERGILVKIVFSHVTIFQSGVIIGAQHM